MRIGRNCGLVNHGPLVHNPLALNPIRPFDNPPELSIDRQYLAWSRRVFQVFHSDDSVLTLKPDRGIDDEGRGLLSRRGRGLIVAATVTMNSASQCAQSHSIRSSGVA